MFRRCQRRSKVFPRAASGKKKKKKTTPTKAGDAGDKSLIPGLGSSPGGGDGNPLWYSYLGNPMNRGGATVHRITMLDMTKVTRLACKGDIETRDILPSYGLV